MCLFLGKSALFGHPLDRLEGVLSWKVIARHHSKVHPTLRHALSGSQGPLVGLPLRGVRVFRLFVWLQVGSGKATLPRPA
jgi:hypothetical protein